MAFTGEATLIANSNQYGQGEGAPRGCAGDGSHFLCHRQLTQAAQPCYEP